MSQSVFASSSRGWSLSGHCSFIRDGAIARVLIPTNSQMHKLALGCNHRAELSRSPIVRWFVCKRDVGLCYSWTVPRPLFKQPRIWWMLSYTLSKPHTLPLPNTRAARYVYIIYWYCYLYGIVCCILLSVMLSNCFLVFIFLCWVLSYTFWDNILWAEIALNSMSERAQWHLG